MKSKTEYDIYQVVVNRPEPSDSPINLTDLSIPVIPIELNSVYHRVNFLTNYGQPRRRFTYRTRFGLLLSVEFSHNFDDNVSPNIEADPMQITRIQELFGTENYTRLTPAEWRRNGEQLNLLDGHCMKHVLCYPQFMTADCMLCLYRTI